MFCWCPVLRKFSVDPYLNFLSLQQIHLRKTRVCTKHGQVGSSPLCTQPSNEVGLSVADGCGTSQGFWFFNSLREKESTPPSSYKGLPQGEQGKRLWLLSEEVNWSKIHGTTHNSGSHTHTWRPKHNISVSLMPPES